MAKMTPYRDRPERGQRGELLPPGARAMTREEWLKRAVRTLRPMLKKAGIEMRPRWQVSMSLTARRNAIGLCAYEGNSASGQTVNILICPSLGDPVEVLSTLFHEMLHAALPFGVHHGKKFVDACRCTGWTKYKPTSAAASDEMRVVLARVAAFLGPFPHDPLTIRKTSGGGTKGGYWPVYVSPVDPRYRLQISARALEEHGPPICPISGAPMEEAPPGKGPRYPAR